MKDRDCNQSRLLAQPTDLTREFEQVLRFALPLPEFVALVERQKILSNFYTSLNAYRSLGILVEPTVGTAIQEKIGLETVFTQQIAGETHITPLRLRNVLVSALSNNGNPTVIAREEANVMGITWPRSDEKFIDSYRRAEQLRQSLLWYTDPT